MKIGLKLWSVNTDAYLREAVKLFAEGLIDYVELYVVPGSEDRLPFWRELDIRYEIHAPHFDSGVNLADKNKFLNNIKTYDLVKSYRDVLHARYVVVHGGIEGDVDELIRQLRVINIGRFLLENKPMLGPTNPKVHCRGALIEECRYVVQSLGCGFCLDFGHAICTANFLRVDPYKYVEAFTELSPVAYHISDNSIESVIDAHKHFGAGNFDLERLVSLVPNDADLAIETKKDSNFDLSDFRSDALYLRTLKGL